MPAAGRNQADPGPSSMEGDHARSESRWGEIQPGPPGASTWFRDHYDQAASRVIEFLRLDDVSLEGKIVADIGTGDGILDLGGRAQGPSSAAGRI